MFEPDFTKSIQRIQYQQVLLKGFLFIKPELLLQNVAAVRIPGGLTPP